MARVKRYKFVKERYSKDGQISTLLAIVCIALLLCSSLVSFAMRGGAGVLVGGIALMTMLLSVYGFYLGLKGFSEKNCSNVVCIIGAISNGLIIVAFLAIYLIGIS